MGQALGILAHEVLDLQCALRMSPNSRVFRRERPWREAFVSGAFLAAAGALAYQRMQRPRRRDRARRVSARCQRSDQGASECNRPRDTCRAVPTLAKARRAPGILRHLQTVTETSPIASHWVAIGPGGARVEWDADIVNDVPDERIAWKTQSDADSLLSIAHAGSVRFQRAPRDRGTELRVELSYDAPAGAVSTRVAKLFGGDPDTEVREDLRRFKQWCRRGEMHHVGPDAPRRRVVRASTLMTTVKRRPSRHGPRPRDRQPA